MKEAGTSLRIGRLSYYNAHPIYWGFEKGLMPLPGPLIPGTPTELNQRLLEGSLEVSLVSSAFFLEHSDQLLALPLPAIIGKGSVPSVNLYHKGSLEGLEGQEIFVTSESCTSVQLLRLLTTHRWKVSPKILPMEALAAEDHPKGLLLIGDSALHHSTLEEYQTTHLCSEWISWQAYPLPFAIFATRKETWANNQKEIVDFSTHLNQSLSYGLDHLPEIIHEVSEASSIPLEALESYYETLSYRLGPEEIAGLQCFAQLSDKKWKEERRWRAAWLKIADAKPPESKKS